MKQISTSLGFCETCGVQIVIDTTGRAISKETLDLSPSIVTGVEPAAWFDVEGNSYLV